MSFLEVEFIEKVNCCIPRCKQDVICLSSFCKNHIKKYKQEKPVECAVCCESLLDEKHPLLNCGHWIHHSCILKSAKDECPLCRTKVKFTDQEKKELKKKTRESRIELYEEEKREIERMIEAERVDDDMLCVQRHFHMIWNNRLFTNVPEETIFANTDLSIVDLSNYMFSRERHLVKRTINKLSRGRSNVIQKVAKMYKIMIEENTDLLDAVSSHITYDNYHIRELIKKTFVSEWNMFRFSKEYMYH
jgi:hypothetical protein